MSQHGGVLCYLMPYLISIMLKIEGTNEMLSQ